LITQMKFYNGWGDYKIILSGYERKKIMRFTEKKGFFGLSREGWAVIVAVLLVGYFAWNAGMLAGTPVGDAADALDEIINPEVDITIGADMVFPKISVLESLGAFASEDIICNAYDESGAFLATATASSGLVTFSSLQVQEGSYIYIQGRSAAPATADGYITPLTRFRVGNGDQADTVSAYSDAGQSILWVDNLDDAEEPHFTFRAPDGADLSAGSVDNLTTADLYFTLTIYIDDDECWYGAPDFTDMVSGDVYKGGIWVTMSGATDYTFEQGSARQYQKWSVGAVIYHAWNFDTRLWQDSLRTGDVNTATFTFTIAHGADFDGGTDTLTFDVYDMMLDTGSWSNSNFVDGGALVPVAVTAYID